MKWEATTPAIILPSQDRGINWGGRRKLLVRVGSKHLWWVSGSKTWSAIGYQEYNRAELSFFDYNNRVFSLSVAYNGRRLSKKGLAETLPQISKLFEIPEKEFPILDRNTTWTIA